LDHGQNFSLLATPIVGITRRLGVSEKGKMSESSEKVNPGSLYGRPWNRREYTIVLFHYFKHRKECHDDTCEYVQQLAFILGRTPASVAMRLHNFASLDPEVTGDRAGLEHIGPLGRDVFHYFSPKQDILNEVGEAFTSEAKEKSTPNLFEPEPARMPLAFGKYEPLDEIGDGGFGKVNSSR
jgi:hypothetical protein